MSAQADDLIALVYKVVVAVLSLQPKNESGIIVPKSYDPTTGTVQVAVGTTIGIPSDSSSKPLARPHLPLMTPVNGLQGGPVGGERCVIVRKPGGASVYLEHDATGSNPPHNASPGIQAGEFGYAHPNASGTADIVHKFTMDGAVSGDGKGGFSHVGGSRFAYQTTGGLSIIADDNAQTITLTAGPLAVILDKAHGEIYVGKSGLASADAIVTATDLQEAINSALANVHAADVTNFALVQPGSGIPTVVPPAAVTATGSSVAEAQE